MALERSANPAHYAEDPAGSGVYRVKGLRDILVAFDYTYTVRTKP